MLALPHLLEETGGRPLLVGYSGGLDSTVLLHVLANSGDARRCGLRAIHVDHGLHADAHRWSTHCRHVCDGLDIALTVVRVDVARDEGHGPEGAARAARHAAFDKALGGDEVLALAHHRGDQAETFLLRALRASGPDGLGAMRRWRRFGRGWLWRPLLDLPHADLLDLAQQHGLSWIEDPSNVETSLDRNFLRHRILPLLRERWPHADAALARSATLSADASALLDAEDARALAAVVHDDDARLIHVDGLRMLPTARRARVLRRWIDGLGLPPLPAQGVARVEADLLDAAPDTDAEFAWSGATIQRWRNLLHADRQHPPLPVDWQVSWDGRAPLPLPGGGMLRLRGAPRFDAPLQVGARRGGERILLGGRAHSHSLKHVLQDLAVPPWQRARLPLLSDAGGRLLAVAGLVNAAEFDAWLRSNGAELSLDSN
jgi:tRNA(Ile)-lysidine synthase